MPPLKGKHHVYCCPPLSEVWNWRNVKRFTERLRDLSKVTRQDSNGSEILVETLCHAGMWPLRGLKALWCYEAALDMGNTRSGCGEDAGQ
jgi:hypothetical protein